MGRLFNPRLPWPAMWREDGNKQTGMQHLDVGDTRLVRQGPESRVQTTEPNEGQVDMWSKAAR